jgi:hypothetical protein
MLYGHVQASSLDETALDDALRLAPYKVVYLPDFMHLSAGRIANLKKFVSEGGGLVASYATAVEELTRAAAVDPSGELAETIANYRSMTGGPYDLYLADHDHPNAQALTPLWHFLPVKALDGGEVWKNIVTGDGLRPILPGVIVSRYGKGRVVYCASALESLFLQQNNSAVGEMLRTMVAKAAPEPPPFELDAPSALIANLTTKGNLRILHLTNWTGNKLERPGANEYYLAPVENVRVRIKIPEGKRLRSVALLVNAPYSKQRKGRVLELVIRRVEAYQAVRMEVE